MTGVNVPDHGVFFSKFVGLLKEQVTPYVAQLQSKVCTNLKFLLRSAFDALLSQGENNNNDTMGGVLSSGGESSSQAESQLSDDDDDEENGPIKRKRKKRSEIFKRYKFSELKHWYHAVHVVPRESNNFSTEEEDEATMSGVEGQAFHQPPLVFIFEDFERFPPQVLQDFILICSEYTADLPLVLMFGVNTAVTSVHRLLPHLVSSKLSIQVSM